MNEDLELLEYLYQNIDMSLSSLKALLKNLKEKENKIKKIIDNEIKEYEKFYKEVEKIIKKSKLEPKKEGTLKKMMANMGVKKEIRMDNSDSAIAHMLTEGITMGIVDISTKIKNYKNEVDSKILNIAKKYLKYQQDEIEKLKEFM